MAVSFSLAAPCRSALHHKDAIIHVLKIKRLALKKLRNLVHTQLKGIELVQICLKSFLVFLSHMPFCKGKKEDAAFLVYMMS